MYVKTTEHQKGDDIVDATIGPHCRYKANRIMSQVMLSEIATTGCEDEAAQEHRAYHLAI